MRTVWSTVPGPIKMAFGYRLFRGWGISPERAALGLTLHGLAAQASKLLLPAAAGTFLPISGARPAVGLLLSGLTAVLVALASPVCMGVLRGEEFPRRVGAFATRATDAVARR